MSCDWEKKKKRLNKFIEYTKPSETCLKKQKKSIKFFDTMQYDKPIK